MQPMARKTKATPDFEKSLHELEELVERMERGDLSLEESLQCFERGVELTRTCQQALRDAEQKVQILLEKEGQPTVTQLDSETDPSGS
jgi:exodeoxyribonuclease VII small subunit